MTAPPVWTCLPPRLRRGLAGLAAGGLGGAGLVALLLACDVAGLRRLLAAAHALPSLGEWLAVPALFAALGLTASWTWRKDGD